MQAVPDVDEILPVVTKRKRSPKIDDDEEGDDCEDCETEDTADEEETEEDRAFINDGKVEKLEVDSAAIDLKNIIQSDENGGRPKRQRKMPTRWEHPDAATVMQKFCDKWNVTEEDIKEILTEEIDDNDNDSSFHSSEDDESNVETDDDQEEEDQDEEEEEETETDYETSEDD